MKLREGYVFTGVCDCVHRGCLVQGGAWCWGVPGPGGLVPGVWSRGGGCLVPGEVWSGGAWWRPPLDGYCCGRYASYWNAFLFNSGHPHLRSQFKLNRCAISCILIQIIYYGLISKDNRKQLLNSNTVNSKYWSETVNSKSFVGKVLLRIKCKFELN